MRRMFVLLLVMALVAASCSGSEAEQQREASLTTEPPTTESAAREQQASPSPTPGPGEVGGDGIGDRLFPTLGNSGYDVTRYDLFLDLRQSELEAQADLTLTPLVDLDRFNLDFDGLTIRSVSLEGASLTEADVPFLRNQRELTIDPSAVLRAGESVELSVRYSGTPQLVDDPSGSLALGWYTTSWGTFVFNEPTGASTWFPVNDHPRDKASYTITVTVPEGQLAAGPGLLVDQQPAEGGGTSYVWEMRQPMASYLTSVVTGEFVLVEVDDGPVPIRHVLPLGDAERLQARVTTTGTMMHAFESWFGPYPFDAYGIAVVPAPLDGAPALENQTLSLSTLR